MEWKLRFYGTQGFRNAIMRAQEIAADSGQHFIGTGHLLLVLAQDEEACALGFLEGLDCDPDWLIAELQDRLAADQFETGTDLQLSAAAAQCVLQATNEARRLGVLHVATEHLLLGLLADTQCLAARTLAVIGIDHRRVVNALFAAEAARTRARAARAERRVAGISAAGVGRASAGAHSRSAGDTSVWNRFTEPARRAVFFAQEEAATAGASLVDTEHLLLGIVRELDNVACALLTELGSSGEAVRASVAALIEAAGVREASDANVSQMTPAMKRIIDQAYDEARQLDNNYIGTEHLLLGAIRSADSAAGQALAACGIGLEPARDAVRTLQDGVHPTSEFPKWLRLSERTKRAVEYAGGEARRLGAPEISDEHLLLGLVRESDTVAARVIDRLGISLGRIRSEIERQVVRANPAKTESPETGSRAKRVIAGAGAEARLLGSAYVGTEHLLLALIGQPDGLAMKVLARLGADLERARREVRGLQSGGSAREPAAGPAPDKAPRDAYLEDVRSAARDPKRGGQDMWQRFTERARRVVFFAQEEAGRLGENYVSTEHLLLGLLRENDSVAARMLERLGVTTDDIRAEIQRRVTRGDGRLGQNMELTPRAKRSIDLAYDEARLLGNDYLGTEHLLLGLLREAEGLAGRVLAKFVTLEAVREQVRELLHNDGAAAAEPPPQGAGSAPTRDALASARTLTELYRAMLPEVGWRGRSLVSLADVTADQIGAVLKTAAALKAMRDATPPPGRTLWKAPRTLAMIFEKPSLRTRVSFEAGMAQMGGHAINLSPADIGLGTREPVADVACALSRWVDVISARVFSHATVEELAQWATVPVINALSDREHPIQAFADLMTLLERKGDPGPRLKLAYIGDGNNVLHALLLACAKMGVNLSAACPPGYLPDPEYVQLARAAAAAAGATVSVGSDPAAAVADADALYTDVWTSMGQEEERQARLAVFEPYRIDAKLVAKAKPDAIVMHCLPAHCGEEITQDVFDTHREVIFDQAENRMHTQKALIALMVGL